MELIHPVSMGPVLDERELQAARLSPEQEQVIRAVFSEPQLLVRRDELDNMVGSLAAITDKLRQSYGDLERYEESLVPKGYHPVNKEPLDGVEDE